MLYDDGDPFSISDFDNFLASFLIVALNRKIR